MKIDESSITAVVDRLCSWKPHIADELRDSVPDLIDEFDVLELSDPKRNGVGPFSRDSLTSKQAAYDNMPHSGSQRFRVLIAISESGEFGKTRDELSTQLGLRDSSVDARVWELKQGKWLTETEHTRLTTAGSQAAVLIVSDAGKRRLTRMQSAV